MTTIFIKNYTDVQVDIKPEMVDAGVQCIRPYLQPRTKDASVQCKLDAPIITSSPLKEYPYSDSTMSESELSDLEGSEHMNTSGFTLSQETASM